MSKNRICELLGIKYPIFQGGMARISTAQLAAAVSAAGGMGTLACGTENVDWVKAEIKKIRSMTDKPFAVNIMLLSPHKDDLVQLVIDEGVKIVVTGAGNPASYIPMWKAAGIKTIPVVPSVALAQRMEAAGADTVIAEGGESGGHIGDLNTMALIPQVVDAVKIPVVAAGGIADGRGVVAAFALGADGIQLGTRFLLANECPVHPNFKEMIKKAHDTSTAVTGRSTGHPVRIIKNKLARNYKIAEGSGATPAELEKMGMGALYRAVVLGDVQTGSVMAGQVAGMVSIEMSCAEIIADLLMDAAKVYPSLEIPVYEGI